MRTQTRCALAGVAWILFGFSCLAHGKERPNMLVLLTDDLRRDAISCYNPDCPINTTNIDKLAEQGLRFTNGYVTTPICVVSRASILSGRYECSTRLHQFHVTLANDVFERSYPVCLMNSGYFIGQLGKYGLGISPAQESAFNVFEAQEGQGPPFREYQGRMMHDAEWLTIKSREFLDAVPKGTPFCLQVNYKEPHNSSEPAPEDDALLAEHSFARSPYDTPAHFARLPEYVQGGLGKWCYDGEFNLNNDHNPYMRQYFERIVSVDRSIGEILAMLEQRDLAKNTVIVFLSDHGTHFGEKQLSGKWTPYEQSLRIPFIIYDPRPSANKPALKEEMVLNIDLAPTLLELAGVQIPEEMDGVSLEPLVAGKSPTWREAFFFEHFCSPTDHGYIPRSVGLRTKTAKYIRWVDLKPPVEEFFDLSQDPEEINNVVNDPAYRVQVQAARAQFDEWRRENPSTFFYDTYGPYAQSVSKEINWGRFKRAHPRVYEQIAAEIQRLGVTWEDALTDWETRRSISAKIDYWY